VYKEADHKVLTQLRKQERDSKTFLLPRKMFELIHMVTGLCGRTRKQHAKTQNIRVTHMVHMKNKK
jgi:hypothetical protein